MTRDGTTRVLADRIDGQPVGKVNFVLRDSKDRIWITVSTKVRNWMHALRTDLKDGYIARYEDGGFRIAAEGFGFTNEIRLDAAERFLYVVETTGGCISRLRVDERGELRNREVFGPAKLGKGAWPDGIAFDSYGNLWGTMVYSDKLFVLTPEGDLKVLLDEGDPVKVDAPERAFFNNRGDRRCAVRHRPGHRPVDVERHLRGGRPRDGLHRLVKGQADSVLPCSRSGPADGALGRHTRMRPCGSGAMASAMSRLPAIPA